MTDAIDCHHYRITPVNPQAHLYRVTLTISEPSPDGQRLRMPAWIPGSYMIRDYARNVVSIEASSASGRVALTKTDKSTWQAAACKGPLVVRAEIFAHDPSVRGAHLDVSHGFFNATCLCLEVLGQEALGCQLQIDPPPHADDWQVATSLKRVSAEPWGFGLYEAGSYDELIDQPVETGPQRIREFEVAGVPHAIAIRGHLRGDVDRLVADLQTICEQHHSLLGTPTDLDRYVFLLNMPVNGYGGLEHRWSSANVSSRDALPQLGDTGVSDAYRGLLGLLSHEYFHLWNVKRMKPDAFTPYQLDREVHTELLWVFEGVTSYYDDLALRRSGIIDDASYFELLGQTLTRVLRGSGRLKQSVAESSFDAWTRFYKQDANARNSIVSYYAKGALLALALDLMLRSRSEASLDAVMRECWRRYGETGQGLPERGFEEVCEALSGLELHDFFERYVYGSEDPPLADLLATHGVELSLRPPASAGDKGGKPAEAVLPVTLGATLVDEAGRCMVQSVANESPAERAGVSPGDQWLALDGLRLTTAVLDRRLRDFAPGDTVPATLFRGDTIYTTELCFGEPARDTAWLVVDEEGDSDARRAWLDA